MNENHTCSALKGSLWRIDGQEVGQNAAATVQ